MRAVYADRPSPDAPLDALVVGERPDPEPGPGQVAVDVRAASLNMHDVWTLRGVGIKAEQFPMILGMDAAGTLEDGSEVVVYPVVNDPDWGGDRTLDPRRSMLTEDLQGSFAERVVVPKANVLPKPTSLSFAEAACLGTAWLTAYRMLTTRSGLHAGQTMLVQGASGGVSTALITLGVAAGLRVWVTGSSQEKRDLASKLGAHATFEPGARLPERVDGVFDSVGKATWSHSIKSLKPGGVLVTCGATTGEPDSAELTRIFFLQLRVIGSTMGTRQELADLITLCETADLHPQVGLELPMEQAPEAFAAMIEGRTAGKIVLTR
ncbi:NADPH:quinone reductase-like Zn-dependent oxidoreductase [Barrientosiimonas humi]|uniref:NADPH:quinone reductase-like Zn-dependent oxidoreductase n=1 Tax=Barrientosiimonas humi TaxID=999931 RepID=A0A542XB23_9MICO|nr:zinc-binding dehydrogenase [Barrientosiimonas humi]TQL33017.1 NADPH:quinone reductase-like Zn-dependent oxidoreductase [Barrientosiimonas humi]CAG7573007.1 Crotonyl-CoA reductase [Barrientosiimonas humi]